MPAITVLLCHCHSQYYYQFPCRFWSGVLPLLGSGQPTIPASLVFGASGPDWLTRAGLEMRRVDAVRGGVPYLVQLCGVSPTHLARTFRASISQTPTEFINGLRLEQAAVLLTTTSEAITEIALDCGFDNLSYFYHCFRRCYGASPRKYRQAARQAIMP